MIPIVWTTTRAFAEGDALRIVRCEQCDTDYVFEFSVRTSGSGTSVYGIAYDQSVRNARREARKRLREAMDEHVETVPCPVCGWYQSDMVEEICTRIPSPIDSIVLSSVLVSGIALLVGGWVMLLGSSGRDGPQMWPLAVLLGSVVVAVVSGGLGIRRYMTRCDWREEYDPNEFVPEDTRIARGRARSMVLADFERRYGPLPIRYRNGVRVGPDVVTFPLPLNPSGPPDERGDDGIITAEPI